jgi:hypothetical protein
MVVTANSIYSSSFFVIEMSFFCCIEPCSLNVKNVQGRIYSKNGQESCLFHRNSWIPGGFCGFRADSADSGQNQWRNEKYWSLGAMGDDCGWKELL